MIAEAVSDREIVFTRTFHAPRELVFRAWTDPQHLPHWWGPQGFTNTIQAIDVRPGGVWRFIMHGPDGVDYPNKILFLEIDPPGRLVFAHSSGGADDQAAFRTTVTFAEAAGQTVLTMRMAFPTAAEREQAVREYGAVQGGQQTLDRLAIQLAELAPALTVTRVFDAPRLRVFQAWTEPERLARWWGPAGYTFVTGRLDLRPGGVFHYGLRSPAGQEMWGRFTYHAVVAPERLVFVSAFADAVGEIARNPFSPVWPLEVVNVLILAEEAGRTTLTLRGGPFNAAPAEYDAFVAAQTSVQKGLRGTLDQLADYLAQA